MILLTTPYNPGDAHAGASYTHARVVAVELDARVLNVRVALNYVYEESPGVWAYGKVGRLSLNIDGSEFHTLKKIKAKKGDGDIIREWCKAIEQFVIDQALIEGTIVDDPMLDDPAPEATT